MAKDINPEYIQSLIARVNQSPFPHHLSMRLRSIEPDSAELSLNIAPEHFQVFGLVHGGVIATLIDTATFWSVFLNLPQDAGMVNIDLKLNYLQPITEGTLIARGRCIRAGRTLSYAEAEVFDAYDRLCAHGTSTLMTLPGKGMSLPHPKFKNA